MTGLDALRQSEKVSCVLCGVDFPGSEFDSHDTSQEHRRRKGVYVIDRAARKVLGIAPCNDWRERAIADRPRR